MNMMIGMLKSLIPEKGDYRFLFATKDTGTAKITTAEIRDSKTAALIVAFDITIPK